MPTPGATRSGFAVKSIAAGPRELNAAMVSSERLAVPMWLDAPTVSTHGALPGAVMPPYCIVPFGPRPLFPAAATTVTPPATRERREGQRIVGAGLVDAGRDRHVADADVERGFVRLDVLHRRDGVADASRAGCIEDLQDDEMRAGRDTRPSSVGIVAVARDDARDVRAVAVVVVRSCLASDEIHEAVDPLRGAGGVREVVVPRRDARVDDGDADATAVDAELLAYGRGADRCAGAFHRAGDHPIHREMPDERVAGQQ